MKSSILLHLVQSLSISGVTALLPIHAFMACTGTILTSSFTPKWCKRASKLVSVQAAVPSAVCVSHPPSLSLSSYLTVSLCLCLTFPLPLSPASVSLFLSHCLSHFPSVSHPVCLAFSVSLSLCLTFPLSLSPVCLAFSLSHCLYVSLSLCLSPPSISLFLCLTVCVPLSHSLSLSLRLTVSVSLCLNHPVSPSHRSHHKLHSLH